MCRPMAGAVYSFAVCSMLCFSGPRRASFADCTRLWKLLLKRRQTATNACKLLLCQRCVPGVNAGGKGVGWREGCIGWKECEHMEGNQGWKRECVIA